MSNSNWIEGESGYEVQVIKLLVKVLVKLVELLRVQPTVGNCPSDPVCLFYFRSKLCLANRQGSRGPFPTLRLSNKIQS